MMPDQITVSEFVAETNEDYKSPTASNFTTRMSHCRNTVSALEEVSVLSLVSSKPTYIYQKWPWWRHLLLFWYLDFPNHTRIYVWHGYILSCFLIYKQKHLFF